MRLLRETLTQARFPQETFAVNNVNGFLRTLTIDDVFLTDKITARENGAKLSRARNLVRVSGSIDSVSSSLGRLSRVNETMKELYEKSVAACVHWVGIEAICFGE
jgi:hypothetical protein